jgi:ribosomal-protein-alanine N-acetyltransferase
MASQLEIRRAVAADLAAVLALERALPSAPHWSPAEYQSIVASAQSAAQAEPCGGLRHTLLVAFSAERLIGFAAGRLLGVPPQIEADIESVAVHPDERRHGVGRALCRALIDWARAEGAPAITLEVRAASAGALRLYLDLGFVAAARRPAYYADPPDDALLMHCALDV